MQVFVIIIDMRAIKPMLKKKFVLFEQTNGLYSNKIKFTLNLHFSYAACVVKSRICYFLVLSLSLLTQRLQGLLISRL